MSTDIVSLRTFYSSQLGERVVKTLSGELLGLWPSVKDERVLGVGYTLPFLSLFSKSADRVFTFMPARQGACQWPDAGHVATALVYEENLPLPENSIDRILLIHSLEYAENAEEMLKEMWRVLSPNGRMIAVVPNRNGLWARYEHTPFGNGEPYSGGQLLRLLRDANFTAGDVRNCLYFSPSQRFFPRVVSSLYGKIATHFVPYFGGLLVVEAQKRLYQGVPVMRSQSRRILIPALTPQTSIRPRLSVPAACRK